MALEGLKNNIDQFDVRDFFGIKNDLQFKFLQRHYWKILTS